jgi:hypothetical protein
MKNSGENESGSKMSSKAPTKAKPTAISLEPVLNFSQTNFGA